MFRIGLFIVGLIVIFLGILIGAVHILFIPGLFIIGVGLIIFGGAFSKHEDTNKAKSTSTETIKINSTSGSEEHFNMYECRTCNGTGEVWVCSRCGGYAKLGLEDRDDFNLYCERCEKVGEKYDIVEGTCPMCNGNGSF